MIGLEVAVFVVSTVLGSTGDLIKIHTAIYEHSEALHREIKERVKRMRASNERYFEDVKQYTIEGDVLKKAEGKFDEVKARLKASRE